MIPLETLMNTSKLLGFGTNLLTRDGWQINLKSFAEPKLIKVVHVFTEDRHVRILPVLHRLNIVQLTLDSVNI